MFNSGADVFQPFENVILLFRIVRMVVQRKCNKHDRVASRPATYHYFNIIIIIIVLFYFFKTFRQIIRLGQVD